MATLNVQTEKRWWLWTPELNGDGDSKRLNWTEKRWWLWTPKLRKLWLWTPKLIRDGGSKRQTEKDEGSECCNREEMVALNAKTKKKWCLWMPKPRRCDSECPNWIKKRWRLWTPKLRRWWLWTPKLRRYDFERQNREEMVALNAQTKKKWWLWTPKLKGEEMVALNAQVEPRRDGGFEHSNW